MFNFHFLLVCAMWACGMAIASWLLHDDCDMMAIVCEDYGFGVGILVVPLGS